MIVWITLALIALTWAAWLFNGVFRGANRKLVFSSMLLISAFISLLTYYHLGAYSELEQLAHKHQKLADQSISELVEKVQQQELTAEEFLIELRLRAELESEDKNKWLQLGRIFMRFGQYDEADKAYQRAISLEPSDKSRLEVARFYMESGEAAAYPRAEPYLNLVLMEKPNHEGALLLQGFNYFNQQRYQEAINSWQYLLSMREPGSQSAQVLQEQIERARHEMKLQQNNHIKLWVTNLDDVSLKPFNKAFAIVRSQAGGPPIAVRSVALSQLQSGLRLTPNDVMLPDVDLWQASGVTVELRLSQSGTAQPQAGDIYGKTEVLEQLTPGDQFHIELNQTVK